MEAQLQRPSHGHHHNEEDPHNAGLHSVIEGEGEGEGEGEHRHHGEKKSVLKKVKDKAKKIKNTIKKHSHVHDHDHEPRRKDIYQEGYEEESDEDDEIANDPEVHGAPTHAPTLPIGPAPIDREKANVGLVESPRSPNNSPADIPPSNYQSKVTDPTGAAAGSKEAHVAPLIREFGNLNRDTPVSKPESEQRPHSEGLLFNPKSNDPEFIHNDQDSANTEDMSIAGESSSVANKAVSAKDMMVSKLGYGGDRQEGHDSSRSSSIPVSASASEYAHKVTETLAPVYEKVAGAGTAVLSKVQGSAGGTSGGVSMKGYLSEKFRPGDEDKALSEVITNALHKKKGEEEKKVGKVTVSDEVAARLGPVEESKREGEDAVAAGKESSGQGVMDRVTDAVGLWLGKGTGIQTAQDSVRRSYVSDPAGSGAGGTK